MNEWQGLLHSFLTILPWLGGIIMFCLMFNFYLKHISSPKQREKAEDALTLNYLIDDFNENFKYLKDNYQAILNIQNYGKQLRDRGETDERITKYEFFTEELGRTLTEIIIRKSEPDRFQLIKQNYKLLRGRIYLYRENITEENSPRIVSIAKLIEEMVEAEFTAFQVFEKISTNIYSHGITIFEPSQDSPERKRIDCKIFEKLSYQ